MSSAHITNRIVERLRVGEVVWDDEIKGFGARRRAGEGVFYLLRYRFRRRQRWVTIGRHGAPWKPESARREALRLLNLVRVEKRDPAEDRDRMRTEPDLAAVIKRYLTEYSEAHHREGTQRNTKRYLERVAAESIGKQPVAAVTTADVAKLHHAASATPSDANRMLAHLSHVFSLAERWGLRPQNSNPCKGIDRYPENRRERFLSGEEMARLGKALLAAEQGEPEWLAVANAEMKRWGTTRQTPEDPRALAAIRLLVFTGARVSEILTLQWAHIDMKRGVARLPISKTGAKNLPLPKPALAVLRDLKKISVDKNPYVLPGDRKGEHFNGLSKPWQRIRKLAKIEDVRLHDLRHSWASTAVRDGASLFIVGKALGHRQAQTTERYAHLAHDPVLAVADATARKLASAMKAAKA